MTDTTQTTTTRETKISKGKTPKKPAKAMAETKTKTAKAAKLAKPKAEKPPRESREGWGTFALRLPVAERDAFHTAAGPANASRAARIVLNAFSNDDVRAFETAISEAKKLR